MFVELHILQNFAPSNLNRDDTGSPKDCEFGGHRRARISSQCLKRAIRYEFDVADLLPPDVRARRSKRFVEHVTERLGKIGKPEADARRAMVMALASIGVWAGGKDGDALSEYLVSLADAEVDALTRYCIDHWDELIAAHRKLWGDDGSKNPSKDAAKKAAPRGAEKEIKALLDGGKAADLALFGRMLADLPDKNVDAASQVAHAISTNRVSMEFDYYTAVDDLKADDVPGADMIGTVGFNSACFYRYANVDTSQLVKNLGKDVELTRQTVDAFLRASVAAIPTGKQNSMAAHNPPSFILAVVRSSGFWNLANAFLQPVRQTQNADPVQQSIKKLDSYWGRLSSVYGDGAIVAKAAVSLEGNGLETLAESQLATCEELYQTVQRTLQGAATDGGAR